MVEKLNILLDAAAELGKASEIYADPGCVMINGSTRDGEKFLLKLTFKTEEEKDA